MESYKPRVMFIYVGISLLVIGGVFFGGYKYGEKQIPEITKVYGLENLGENQPGEVDFAAFWKAWNVINDKFVYSKAGTSTKLVSNQEKVWGAIKGLSESLGDPYTVFFPPEEENEFESEISGTFEGVGMEIGMKENVLTVVAPLKNTPAEKAGMRSGDKIIEINGLSTSGMSIDTAVKHIRGKRDTTVELKVVRADVNKPLDISIVRNIIDIPTISFEIKTADGKSSPADGGGLRGDGVFVLKLHSFTSQSPTLFRGALREFVLSDSNKLVLDLRGNPGGYLEAAVDMASWFLPAGKIVVKEEYSKEEGDQTYRSRGYDIFNENLKMVILVNGGSASASEILAGSLQEYGIAKLVGTKTFGKGSVQELVKITPDTSLKVTIARWLTPNGRSISDEGLDPDYLVEINKDDLSAKKDPQMDKAVSLLVSGKPF